MSSTTHDVIVRHRSDLKRGMDKDERAVKKMSRGSVRAMKKMERQAQSTGRAMARMGSGIGRMAGFGGAVGGAVAAQSLANLQERYEQIATNQQLNESEKRAIRQRVQAVATSPNIRLREAELLGAVEEVETQTGDVGFALENLTAMAMASRGNGATPKDVGAVVSQLKVAGFTPEQVKRTLAELTVLGEQGSFVFKEFATQGNELFGALSQVNKVAPQSTKQMGALLQIAQRTTGKGDVTKTAFAAFINDLTDPTKQDKLQKLGGISVFSDPKRKIYRPIEEIYRDVIISTGGNIDEIGQVFGSEARKLFSSSASDYKRTGQFGFLDQLMATDNGGQRLEKKSTRMAGTVNAKVQGIASNAEAAADTAINDVMTSSYVRALDVSFQRWQKSIEQNGFMDSQFAIPHWDSEKREKYIQEHEQQTQAVKISITTEPGMKVKATGANVSTGELEAGQ